jgi:hypothetical protein
MFTYNHVIVTACNLRLYVVSSCTCSFKYLVLTMVVVYWLRLEYLVSTMPFGDRYVAELVSREAHCHTRKTLIISIGSVIPLLSRLGLGFGSPS